MRTLISQISHKFMIISVALLCLNGPTVAEPIAVHHVLGFVHGFVVLKDTDGKILASGNVTQSPSGDRLTTVLSLRFKDGSIHQETSVFSQRRVLQLLNYKLIQKGPSFKAEVNLALNTATGEVGVDHIDAKNKEKVNTEHVDLPADLSNGIITTVLTNIDPKTPETTVSMLVSTPKFRVVKLKISPAGEDTFFIGGEAAKATHYIIKIDLGGVVGVVAPVVGKQPPPIHAWVAAGNAPILLKSEGPLYEGGPIWRIELASPTWPKGSDAR